jgi:uncharacterized membrane protein YfcA
LRAGSLLTLPVLILLGLDANVANGTNRIGVVLQNIFAVATFRRRGALPLAGSWKLIVPSVAGAIMGAELAVDLNEALLRRIIGVLILVLSVAALANFVWNHQVQWTFGLLLGAGQAAGGWVAARFAVERGARFVRSAVVVVAVISALAVFAGVGV